MLAVSKLKRAYGDFVAADEVSFTIAKGEIVGLLGHNGAGKTTVMKMLSGYLEPSAGTIQFQGLALADETGSVIVEIQDGAKRVVDVVGQFSSRLSL